MFDILIKNGIVINGKNESSYKADIGIKDKKIVFIGSANESYDAGNIIDATEKVIMPGFIDTHSHSDLWIIKDPYAKAKVFQGVTTEVLGNCGLTPTPLWGKGGEQMAKYVGYILGDIEESWGWKSISDYFKILKKIQPAVNVAYLFGYNNLRASVAGEFTSRPLSHDELNEMKLIADNCL